MSRNNPPDTLIYATGGGAGSKAVIGKSSVLTISPLSDAAFSAATFGANRLDKTRPALFALSRAGRTYAP